MRVALSEYFIYASMQENLTILPDADQVFKGREDERFMNLSVISEKAIKEIDKLNR